MSRNGNRGAVVLEAALVLPLLVLILFGMAEIGRAWHASNRVSTSAHGGALVLSRDVENRFADFDALSAVRGSMGDSVDRVLSVIVYRTADPDGAVPGACSAAATGLSSGTTGVAGVCNVYSGAYLQSMTAADFDSPDCFGDPDSFLCPTERRDVFAATERIGIEIRFDHDWVTWVLPGNGRIITDRGVAALEPELSL